jgi:hypothetical protein
MTISKHGRRFWRVYDDDGSLVCVACYRKGAQEVVRRLNVARNDEDETDPVEAARETASVPLAKTKGEG